MLIVPEIIKSLDVLLNQGDSPIGEDFGVIASKQIIKEARDLINSQQKEVERLISILLKLLDGITIWGIINNVDTTEFSLIPILEEQKNNIVRKIEAETIKEFAERLKEKLIDPVETWLTSDVVTEGDIDNLVKEMVGEPQC